MNSINLSLHFLEQVILSLRAQQLQQQSHASNLSQAGVSLLSSISVANTGIGGHVHIPYRNSVLTNMLRDSLGGNCRSCFVLALSIDRLHFEETLSKYPSQP